MCDWVEDPRWPVITISCLLSREARATISLLSPSGNTIFHKEQNICFWAPSVSGGITLVGYVRMHLSFQSEKGVQPKGLSWVWVLLS